MTTSLPEDSPVGFGFRPTDEEIMNHYLRLKMIGKDSEVDNGIAEVDDICTFDPWELPPKSKIKSNDQIWWFFTRRDPERKTTKRKSKTGSWGLTGEEGQIKGRDGRVLGKKKYVVFFTGHTRGRRSNWVIREYHPLPENVLPKQRHYVICRLENKTDEKAGLTSCDDGEPSCNISSEVEIAPSAISEVHGHAEGNAESPSQLVFSPDDFLTEVEMNSIFEDCLNDDQKTQFVHENHPNPENSLPHQRSYVLCRLKEKANDKANTPDSGEGNPCGDMSEVENPVTPAAIPSAAHGNEVNQESFSQSLQSPVFTNEEISLPSPVGSSRDRNGMQAPYGAGEPEEPPEEIVDRLIADSDVDPYPKYYWEASYNPFNDRIAQASSWSPYYVDGLVRCDTNTEGVNEQKHSSLFNSPAGSNKFRHLQMDETTCGEPQCCYVSIRDQFSEEDDSYVNIASGGFSAEESPNYVPFSRRRCQRRIQLQDRDSSTAISRNKVRESETHNSLSLSEYCFFRVHVIVVLLAAFFLLVQEARRKKSSFVVLCCVVLCSVLFFLV